MTKRTCPNGHIYDYDIYGDECPLCPKGAGVGPQLVPGMNEPAKPVFGEAPGGGTRVSSPAQPAQPAGGAFGANDDRPGETVLRGAQGAKPYSGGTVIRQPKGAPVGRGRKIVGFLVTYNHDPLGKVYNLYEGKNFIGRDRNCDISLPEDRQVSGRHMSILYRNADNKFKYRDEQSSNGTFVNKELSDEGELHNYDIIRVGSTVFIFIVIPKLS